MRLRVDALIGGFLLASCVAAPAWQRPQPIMMTAPQRVAVAEAAPRDPSSYEATGLASWYGDELRGEKTANGEAFDPNAVTAAHRTLPLSSYAEVTTLDTGRTILVRINDRGPYHGNRLIDLSMGAARQLGIVGHGARMVRVRVVDPSERDKLALRRGQAVSVRASVAGDDLDRLRDRNGWSPPPSTGVAIPAGGGPYFIRIGTFSSRHRAESMAGRLGARLSQVDGLYQVRLGPFDDEGKVKAALAPLAAKGYSDVRIVRQRPKE
jgi:rare lipoprotein A